MIRFVGGGSRLAGIVITFVNTTTLVPNVLVTSTKLVVIPRNMAGGIVTKVSVSRGFTNIETKSIVPDVTGGAGLTLVTATLNCRLYIRVAGKMLNVTGA